jgi:hypothetical protein
MRQDPIHDFPGSMSRRTGLAAGIVTALGLVAPHSLARAQPATPANGTPEATEAQYLFLQGFQACDLIPDPTSSDRFTLTLHQHAGQTLYFSDRPKRIVGVIDTATFVTGFAAETESDPANAALVAQSGPDDDVTHVIELLDLAYDAATLTATYEVRMLGEEEASSLPLAVSIEQSVSEHRQYGPTQLFIDSGGLMQLVAYGAQDVYLSSDTACG